MTGSRDLFGGARPTLAAVRGWARERFSDDDLQWVGLSSAPAADKARYTRTLAEGGLPEQFQGLLGAFATPPSMRSAARRAEQLGEPTVWAGLDLLMVPIEYAIEARPSWWCLGTRPAVARLLLDAFGLAGVVSSDDPDLIERLLAWLPAYLPGRGCGAYTRQLVTSVDPESAKRWLHFPGEDRAPVAPTRLEAERDLPTLADPMESDAPSGAMGSDTDSHGLDVCEVLAVRPLAWYARRPADPCPPPAFLGGLLVSRGPAPALAPEDGVVRLTSDIDSYLDLPPLRVVPPWTQVRFLPPNLSADETPA